MMLEHDYQNVRLNFVENPKGLHSCLYVFITFTSLCVCLQVIVVVYHFIFGCVCKVAKCNYELSWFQTFSVFCMLYVFFWVIPWRLNFICRRFGTLCLFHLHRHVGIYLLAYEDGTECSETSAYKIQTPGYYPEENIQHTEIYLYLFAYIIYCSCF